MQQVQRVICTVVEQMRTKGAMSAMVVPIRHVLFVTLKGKDKTVKATSARSSMEICLMSLGYIKGDGGDESNSNTFTKNVTLTIVHRHIPLYVGHGEYVSGQDQALSGKAVREYFCPQTHNRFSIKYLSHVVLMFSLVLRHKPRQPIQYQKLSSQ
jgi:hypothetical protein